MKAAALVCRRRPEDGGESEADGMAIIDTHDWKVIDTTLDYIMTMMILMLD